MSNREKVEKRAYIEKGEWDIICLWMYAKGYKNLTALLHETIGPVMKRNRINDTNGEDLYERLMAYRINRAKEKGGMIPKE